MMVTTHQMDQRILVPGHFASHFDIPRVITKRVKEQNKKMAAANGAVRTYLRPLASSTRV
jgi:hypothetical protein